MDKTSPIVTKFVMFLTFNKIMSSLKIYHLCTTFEGYETTLICADLYGGVSKSKNLNHMWVSGWKARFVEIWPDCRYF